MLLLDNIIYEIQKAGGVSIVWSAVLEACLKCEDFYFKILDSGNNSDNLFYPENIPQERIIQDNISQVFRRYRDVRWNENVELFHSSYFRVHASPKVKNIVTIHDFVYEKFDQGLRQRIHLWQKNRALKKASAIVCVSNSTKNDLLEYHPWIDENIVQVIHNGVGPEFHPLESKTDGTAKPYALYVGGRQIHKNFSYALDLLKTRIAQNLDLELRVVGGGDFTDVERKYIVNHHLLGKVTHVGPVSTNELNELYSGAFVLVYPSFYEGFGIPPIEAMAAGCPVICSNTSSIPEVVGDSGLLIDPDIVEDGENYLSKLSDADFRQQIIARGFNQAAKFSWTKTGAETVNLYRDLMDY